MICPKCGSEIPENYLLCEKCGEEHPTSLTMFANLAQAILKTGEKESALKYATKAYEQSMKLFGENHHVTLNGASALALSKLAYCEYQEALTLIEGAYKNAVQVFGSKHSYTKTIQNHRRKIKIHAFLHGVR